MTNLKQANTDYLKVVNPAFIDGLPDDSDNAWKVCWGGINGDWAINLQSKQDASKYLYTQQLGAIAYDNERVNQWKASPSRLLLNDYSGLLTEGSINATPIYDATGKHNLDELDLVDVHDLNQDLEPLWVQCRVAKYLKDFSSQLCYAPPSSTDCLLVISGLGLGGHIQPLIDYLDPSAIVIVEPDLGILSHSLHTIDYEKLISRFDGPNSSLDFVISQTPEGAVSEIRSLITKNNLFYLQV